MAPELGNIDVRPAWVAPDSTDDDPPSRVPTPLPSEFMAWTPPPHWTFHRKIIYSVVYDESGYVSEIGDRPS